MSPARRTARAGRLVAATAGLALAGLAAAEDPAPAAPAQTAQTAPAQTAPAAAAPEPLWLLLDGILGEAVRDVAPLGGGSAIVVGITHSRDFPTTPGALQPGFHPESRDSSDGFVARIGPDGRIAWATLLGGPGNDAALAVAVREDGRVVVGGRAGPRFPITEGAVQPRFAGGVAGDRLGPRDGFVCELAADGSAANWCTYFGTRDAGVVSDVALDASGRVLLITSHAGGRLPEAWFEGVYQPANAGARDALVAVLAPDGSRVVWASFLGGRLDDGENGSVAAGRNDSVYVLLGGTESTDLPTTENAAQRVHAGGADLYLARFAPDGRSLLGATYLGGSDRESAGGGALAAAPDGSVYVAATTLSSDLATGPGAAQASFAGAGSHRTGGRTPAAGDAWIARVSPGGRLMRATFLGGRYGDGADAVAVEADGVVVVGTTFSPDFPTTRDALSSELGGSADAFAARLGPDLDRLRHVTLWGGEGLDTGRAVAAGDGTVWLGGESRSREFGALRRLHATSAAALLRLGGGTR